MEQKFHTFKTTLKNPLVFSLLLPAPQKKKQIL
jgi:hypothetical protein